MTRERNTNSEIARYSESKLQDYEESVKVYRKINNILNTAEDNGRAEAAKEIARKMKELKIPTDDIVKTTGLTIDQINDL